MANISKMANNKHNQKLAAKLQEFLSESYVLLLQVQNLHWNIEGENFYSVHKLTEEMYNEQFAAIDEVAERLRTIGHKAQVDVAGYKQTETTLKSLIAAQESASQTANELIEVAQEVGDEATADLAIERLQIHQKNTWMLKSQSK